MNKAKALFLFQHRMLPECKKFIADTFGITEWPSEEEVQARLREDERKWGV